MIRFSSNAWRTIQIVLVCALVVFSHSRDYAGANTPFQVSAKAALLMDVESGRIMYAKNMDQQLRIASITKIMTAILAIEEGKLKDKVITSKNAYGVEGSSIYLRLGEKLTLEEMLYGLMLRSGNDSAVAIAEHIGGSLEGFVFLMNQKAAELGMTNTVFSNPHGLDTHEEHYSTARDMAILTAYALKHDVFREIVKAKSKTASLEGKSWDRQWSNKNRLLNKYPYADGVKTGFTKRAGRTLVSSATKDGHQLVAVTLDAPDDWNDHIRMFEYGFNHYEQIQLAIRGEKVEHRNLNHHEGEFRLRNDLMYPLTEEEKVSKRVVMDPAFKEETLTSVPYPAGYIYYSVDEEKVGRVPIEYVPKEDEPTFLQHIKGLFLRIVGGV